MNDSTIPNGGTLVQPPTLDASPAINELITALAKAQGEFQPIEKDKTAKITPKSGGMPFSYSYADLATIFDAVRPVLSKNGLAIFQPVSMTNGSVVIKTVLAHVSGQWAAGSIAFRSGDDPRSVASVITYGRRYGLITMIGVAPADEDDDAEAATPPARNHTNATPPARSAPPAAPPARSASPAPAQASTGEVFTITKVWPKDDSKKKPYGVVFSDGEKYSTFSDTIGTRAIAFQRQGTECVRELETKDTPKGKFVNLVGLHAADRQIGSDMAQEQDDLPEWVRDDGPHYEDGQ